MSDFRLYAAHPHCHSIPRVLRAPCRACRKTGFRSQPDDAKAPAPLLEGVFGNSPYLSRLALREQTTLAEYFHARS